MPFVLEKGAEWTGNLPFRWGCAASSADEPWNVPPWQLRHSVPKAMAISSRLFRTILLCLIPPVVHSMGGDLATYRLYFCR